MCKYTATIRYVRDIPSTLKKAIQIAQYKDNYYNIKKIVNLYLGNYLASLFAGAFDKQDFTPLVLEILFANDSQGNNIIKFNFLSFMNNSLFSPSSS